MVAGASKNWRRTPQVHRKIGMTNNVLPNHILITYLLNIGYGSSRLSRKPNLGMELWNHKQPNSTSVKWMPAQPLSINGFLFGIYPVDPYVWVVFCLVLNRLIAVVNSVLNLSVRTLFCLDGWLFAYWKLDTGRSNLSEDHWPWQPVGSWITRQRILSSAKPNLKSRASCWTLFWG